MQRFEYYMATARWTSVQVRSPNGEQGIIGLIGRESFPAVAGILSILLIPSKKPAVAWRGKAAPKDFIRR